MVKEIENSNDAETLPISRVKLNLLVIIVEDIVQIATIVISKLKMKLKNKIRNVNLKQTMSKEA